jgi:hypothetical protein
MNMSSSCANIVTAAAAAQALEQLQQCHNTIRHSLEKVEFNKIVEQKSVESLC